jgi:hypothetical protein
MGASVRTACVVIALLALACCGLPLSGQTPNPVPLINNPLSPTSVAPGGPGFTLTVNGTGFVSGSVVNWNGSPLTTHFVSSSQLTATIPASNIATAGTATIRVSSPGDGLSNVEYLGITNTASTLTFTTFLTTGGGGAQSAAVVGDFNGDGKLDVATDGNPNNAVGDIILGNGDGTFGYFSETAGCSALPCLMVAADFNGDGKLDLAFIDGSSYGNAAPPTGAYRIWMALGNGDGTFQTGTSTSLSYFGTAVVAGDFNGDGKMDLAIALGGTNGAASSVGILLGNGDGTFQQPVSYMVGASIGSNQMVLGDFNGDGKLDLALASKAILLGNGDGTFQPVTSGPLPAGWVVAADVNGDGKLDLIEEGEVFLGNGDGTFQAGLPYSGWTGSAPAIGDFNADGKLDLAFLNATTGGVSVILGNGDGTFQAPMNFSGSTGNSAMVAGDFNGDGKMDLLMVSSTTGYSNQLAKQTTVLLQGSFPLLTLSPDNFFIQPPNYTPVGTTSPPVAVTVTNSGTVPTSVSASGIAFVGLEPDGLNKFEQTNNCTSVLAPGATCQIEVVYVATDPTVPRTFTNMWVPSGTPGNPGAAAIAVGGIASEPFASLAPTTVTFPSQYVGTSGLPQTVTVTNNGAADLQVASVTASPADFGVLSNCTNSVPAGSSCTIGVFFDPTASGTRTGTLTIAYNAATSPQTVTLTGSGQDFSVMPGSAASATVTAGQTASYSIAVAPAGGFAASVALSCSGGPAGSACAVSPSTMALSGSAAQTAMVTVTTAANGWLLPFRGGWPRDARYRQTPMILILAAMFLLMFVASRLLRRSQNLAWIRVVGFAALVTLGLTLTSCGGGSGSGAGGTNPQAGTYTVTVTGNFTSGATTLNHSAKLTLVVQ